MNAQDYGKDTLTNSERDNLTHSQFHNALDLPGSTAIGTFVRKIHSPRRSQYYELCGLEEQNHIHKFDMTTL